MEYLAETIKDPAEIRVHLEPVRDELAEGTQKYVVSRYYLRRMDTDDKARDFVVIFRGAGEAWDVQVGDGLPGDEIGQVQTGAGDLRASLKKDTPPEN